MADPTIPEEVVERAEKELLLMGLCMSSDLRREYARVLLAACLGPSYAVVPVEIDAKTLCAVLMIAREKATVQDKRTAAAAATLAGASPGQMQVGTEIGAEMARDYRYIVAAYTASRQEEERNHD